MQGNYQIIITPYDGYQQLNFKPIQSNDGDTDSVEILTPYYESIENSCNIPDEIQESILQSDKKALSSSSNEKKQPNNNLIETYEFFLKSKGSLSVNNSFSFANCFKNKSKSDIEDSPIVENKKKRGNPSRSSLHTTDRLYRMSKILKEKKKHEIQEKEKEKLENCSFKPQINKKSSLLAVARSIQDLTKPNERKKHSFDELPLKNANKIPKINETSKNILKDCVYSSIPIYERLYLKKDANKKNKLTGSSEKSKRNSEISSKKCSKITMQKAAERFKKEYESILNSIIVNNGTLSNDFSQLETIQILYSLGFLSSFSLENLAEKLKVEEMWKLLTKSQENVAKVSRKRLFDFLICVQGLDPYKLKKFTEDCLREKPMAAIASNLAVQLSKDDEKFKGQAEENVNLQTNEFSTEEDLCRYRTIETLKSLGDTQEKIICDAQNFISNNSEQNKILVEVQKTKSSCSNSFVEFEKFNMRDIHQKFEILFRNRLMSQNEQKFKSPIEDLKFMPNILENSRKIAEIAREKIKIDKKLISSNHNTFVEYYQTKRQAKINSLYAKKMEEITGNCTFKPEKISKACQPNMINFEKGSLFLKKLASPKIRLPEKNPEQLEYEKSRKECTFKPNILKSRASNSSKSKAPRNLLVKKRDFIENKENLPNENNKTQKKRKTSFKKEIIEIDVKLNAIKKEKICIHRTSNLKKIVGDFSLKHSKFYLIS